MPDYWMLLSYIWRRSHRITTAFMQIAGNAMSPPALFWLGSMQPNFIWQKRASAPVYVAIHHHVRLLFE
jgi:hypothetical protein